MKLSVEISGLDSIASGLKGIEGGLVDDRLLEALAEGAKDSVLKRTARGVDVRGRPFAPYSRSWARERARSGRPSGKVDLRYTGAMLSSLDAVTDLRAGTATLSFKDRREEAKAGAHNTAGAGRKRVKREFFGLTESEREALVEMAGEYIARVIDGADKG